MVYSFFVTLREGLEAGLILAIILAYLRAIHQTFHFRTVLIATAAAVAGSVAAGAGVFVVAGELEGRAADAFEGAAMLTAVVVLSWMIIWMKRQAVHMRRSLEREVAQAVGMGSVFALALIPFTAVGREGVETVLFLFAGASGAGSASLFWAGAGAGLALAVALAVVFYQGAARIPLRLFFNVTGALLIVLAGGLLVNGLKELYEIRAIPSLGPHLWDTYHIVADNSPLGRFLSTLLGYDSSPYLGLVVAHLAYLSLALAFFAWGRGRPAAHRPPLAAERGVGLEGRA